MQQFRTSNEVERAEWGQLYTNVAVGKLYASNTFPEHEYMRLGSLGKQVGMVELNVGSALIDQMVSDTVTEYKLNTGNDDLNKEIEEWMMKTDFESALEDATRQLFSTGYTAMQVVRGEEDEFHAMPVDANRYYPTIPLITYKSPEEVRIISPFEIEDEGEDSKKFFYVETHEVGVIYNDVYAVEQWNDIEGKKVSIDLFPQFEGVQEVVQTGLDFIPIKHINRRKSCSKFFGESILLPVWTLLQEASEIQTQMRNEMIKHGAAKFYGNTQNMVKTARNNPCGCFSPDCMTCIACSNAQRFDSNMEVMHVEPGDPIPGYMQRDLQFLDKGKDQLNEVLSKIAAIVGSPASIFNVEDRSSNTRAETDRRKEKRYIKNILRAQNRVESLARGAIDMYLLWSGRGDQDITFKFDSPFELSQTEKCELVRKLNPTDKLISQKQAIDMVFSDRSAEEREELLNELIQQDGEEFANLSSLQVSL